MIPRIIHAVWVGDESKTPRAQLDTWKTLNPSWELRLWGNMALEHRHWRSKRLMRHYANKLYGVADCMRWEILLEEGGFAIDADSECLRPLDDWLFDVTAFAVWENEIERPGLIANGFFACRPKYRLVEDIVRCIASDNAPREPWQTTGPQLLTDLYRAQAEPDLTIYPSHYLLPEHFTGRRYSGAGPVYARHAWTSTGGKPAWLP